MSDKIKNKNRMIIDKKIEEPQEDNISDEEFNKYKQKFLEHDDLQVSFPTRTKNEKQKIIKINHDLLNHIFKLLDKEEDDAFKLDHVLFVINKSFTRKEYDEYLKRYNENLMIENEENPKNDEENEENPQNAIDLQED